MSLSRIQKIWPDLQVVNEYLYSDFLLYLENFASGLFTPPTTFNLDATLNLIAPLRQELRKNPPIPYGGVTRKELVDSISTSGVPIRDCLNSTCFCFSILLALIIVPPDVPHMRIPWQQEWQEGSTILDVINAAFPCQPPAQRNISPMVSPKLTLEYLQKEKGYIIQFVDSLSEHLRIINEGNNKWSIRVYKHKIFLKNEIDNTSESLLPKRLVQETLDSLSLLLPDGDNTRKFLKKKKMLHFYEIGTCSGKQHFELDHYHYWRDRLNDLTTIAEKAPTGIRSIMPGRDWSNVHNAVTFWVTVVLFTVLTVASIVLGALSYDVGRRQLDLAKIQYKLSLAQACATMNSSQLPGWCL
jgi:hypothetical protein